MEKWHRQKVVPSFGAESNERGPPLDFLPVPLRSATVHVHDSTRHFSQTPFGWAQSMLSLIVHHCELDPQ